MLLETVTGLVGAAAIHQLNDAESHGHDHHWRVPGVAQINMVGQLVPKQPTRLPAKTTSACQASRRRPRSSGAARSTRRPANQAHSCDSSQERADHRAAERAARKAAQAEALEREWRVQQVAGELGRQADLLERHRYLVAKYGASDVAAQIRQPGNPSNQVTSQQSVCCSCTVLTSNNRGRLLLAAPICKLQMIVFCNCLAA